MLNIEGGAAFVGNAGVRPATAITVSADDSVALAVGLDVRKYDAAGDPFREVTTSEGFEVRLRYSRKVEADFLLEFDVFEDDANEGLEAQIDYETAQLRIVASGSRRTAYGKVPLSLKDTVVFLFRFPHRAGKFTTPSHFWFRSLRIAPSRS